MARYSICTPGVTKTLPSHGGSSGIGAMDGGSSEYRIPGANVKMSSKSSCTIPPPTVQHKKTSAAASLQTAATRTKVRTSTKTCYLSKQDTAWSYKMRSCCSYEPSMLQPTCIRPSNFTGRRNRWSWAFSREILWESYKRKIPWGMQAGNLYVLPVKTQEDTLWK